MPVPDQQPKKRAAMALVIIMSGLVVLALLGVVFGFVKQARIFMAAKAQHPAAAAPAAVPGAAAVLTLAPRSRIVSATTDSGKLVLHVDTPTGGEVEVIDLASGQLTAQVRTH